MSQVFDAMAATARSVWVTLLVLAVLAPQSSFALTDKVGNMFYNAIVFFLLLPSYLKGCSENSELLIRAVSNPHLLAL